MKSSFHAAYLSSPLMDPFEPSSLQALSSHPRSGSRFCGPWALRLRIGPLSWSKPSTQWMAVLNPRMSQPVFADRSQMRFRSPFDQTGHFGEQDVTTA
jgi:hypothetical protein